MAIQTTLTMDDIRECAERLGIETCALKAVYEVESAGNGFLPDGRPKILFEGHIFWRELKKVGIDPIRWAEKYPSIVYPKWVKTHYKGGAKEYDRLEIAKSIHEEAALKSASWGMFQIMGFNFAICGFADVLDYVEENYKGAYEQLEVFGEFMINSGWTRYLKNLDFARFAEKYNGPGYHINKYDIKLKEAYDKCKRK